ncbi:MAG: acyl-CoA thioesterase [Legionella sp.]
MSNPANTYQKTFNIAWGDMDALGHVNNVRYFDYFQQARIEWLDNLQLDLDNSQGPVVVHVACTYLKSVIYPACLTIKSSIDRVGRSSITMTHELYQDQTLMAQGVSKIVWVDYQLSKSIPLPETLRQLLNNP